MSERVERPDLEGMAERQRIGTSVEQCVADLAALVPYALQLEQDAAVAREQAAELVTARAEVGRLTKARAKLAERLRYMADYDHRDLITHRPYSLEECPFIGCKDNAYALRLGKPRGKAARP